MESLDALVRRVDEDRWLAARFAPRLVRERLTALYALNHEIARAAEGASNPTLGEMRLLWWRDAIAEIHSRRQRFTAREQVGDALVGGIAAGEHAAIQQQRFAGLPARDFRRRQCVEVHAPRAGRRSPS